MNTDPLCTTSCLCLGTSEVQLAVHMYDPAMRHHGIGQHLGKLMRGMADSNLYVSNTACPFSTMFQIDI